MVTIGVDVSGRAAAEAKGPGMELSAYGFDTLHEDASCSWIGATTEHVRARV